MRALVPIVLPAPPQQDMEAATKAYVDALVGGGGTVLEQDLGDGSSRSFSIAHNFGTRAVVVVVYRNVDPWDEVDVSVLRPDENTVVLEPADTWAVNEFHVVVRA